MADYATLKSTIEDNIKQNGVGAITGPILQSALLSMINSLGAGFQFIGIATPDTNPGTPDHNVAYVAGVGQYSNFGSAVEVPVGCIGVFKYNGTWTKEIIDTDLSEAINSASFGKRLFGRGDVLSGAYLQFIPKHTYRVSVNKTNWGYTGTSTTPVFRLRVKVSGEWGSDIVSATSIAGTPSSFVFRAVDADYYYMYIRGDENTFVDFTIEDITQEVVTDLYFIGENDGAVNWGRKSGGFIGGHTYRLYPTKLSWPNSATGSQNILFIDVANNPDLLTEGTGNVGYRALSVRSTDTVQDNYVISFPETYDGVSVREWWAQIYGRAEYGTEVRLIVEDITTLLELVGDINSGEITHLVPDNAGQLNAVKRMRQITDIEWTPAFDMPRLNWTTGGIWSRDVFKAGRTYRGIPYGRCQKGSASFGYDTFKVGQFISIETFITSLLNKNTALEKESEFNLSIHDSCYYSTVCAAAASYALGLGYVTSRQFPQRSDMTNMGYVNSGGSQFDLRTLKLGDVLSDPEVHTAMVTDVVKDSGGNVKYVEVSESTPDGQENPNVYGTSEEGAPYGGTCQRFWWTPEEFYSHWGSYMVLRYQNIAGVTYTPSPYVQIGKETAGYAPRLMACLPYMGNAFRYRVGYIPNTDIIINVTGYTKMRVLKDGQPWKSDNTTDLYDITGLDKIAVGFSQVGEYEAYLCNLVAGEEAQKSLHCKWSVVSSITPL